MSGFPGHQSQKRHVFRDRRDTFWKSLVSHYSSILGWPQLGPWGLLLALVKSFEGRAALSELELGRYRPWRSRLREKLRWRLPLEDECRPVSNGPSHGPKERIVSKIYLHFGQIRPSHWRSFRRALSRPMDYFHMNNQGFCLEAIASLAIACCFQHYFADNLK